MKGRTEYGPEVDHVGDPLVRAGLGAEEEDDGRLLAGLVQQAVDVHRVIRELVAAPRHALVRRVAVNQSID